MKTHVTLLEKQGLIGVITISFRPDTTVLCHYDPRTPERYMKCVSRPEAAKEEYFEAIAKSRDSGWRVAYTGEPNYG